jgi:hypothetical protein
MSRDMGLSGLKRKRTRLEVIQPPGPDKYTLQVGTNGLGEVVVNHGDLQPDANGVGHLVFSPEQARRFAKLLLDKALDAEMERRR